MPYHVRITRRSHPHRTDNLVRLDLQSATEVRHAIVRPLLKHHGLVIGNTQVSSYDIEQIRVHYTSADSDELWPQAYAARLQDIQSRKPSVEYYVARMGQNVTDQFITEDVVTLLDPQVAPSDPVSTAPLGPSSVSSNLATTSGGHFGKAAADGNNRSNLFEVLLLLISIFGNILANLVQSNLLSISAVAVVFLACALVIRRHNSRLVVLTTLLVLIMCLILYFWPKVSSTQAGETGVMHTTSLCTATKARTSTGVFDCSSDSVRFPELV
jgi:hypothetical protein